MHTNYHFKYSPAERWPLNSEFVKKYHDRWKEYPSLPSEAAYSGLYIFKTAVEQANRLAGGWPDDEAIIRQLEGLMHPGPAGNVYIRPDNHRATRTR